jgi:hypothetical protein
MWGGLISCCWGFKVREIATSDALARRELSAYIEKRCVLLGLRSQCPFIAHSTIFGQVEFAAFLPDFGSKSGIFIDVVIPENPLMTSAIHAQTAHELGGAVSFVNAASMGSSAEEFLDALRDWGYFGETSALSEAARQVLGVPNVCA